MAGIGFVKGVNDDDVGGGRAIVRFHPNENLTIDANYTTQTETSGGSSRYTPAGVAAFAGGPIPPIQGCDLCNTDVTLSPWSDNLKIFGLTVEYKTRFRARSPAPPTSTTAPLISHSTRRRFWCRSMFLFPPKRSSRAPAKSIPAKLRFASDLNSPVNFVAGVFREHETQDLAVQVITTGGNGLVTGPFSTSTAQDALDFPGVGNTFFGRTDQRSDTQYAGFGEATWKITDAWTAVAGVRYFTETLNGVQTQTHPFGGFPGAPNLVPVNDPEQTFNKVTWKINSSYKFSDELLAYGTISTGFRSGGLNAVSEPFEPIPPAYCAGLVDQL